VGRPLGPPDAVLINGRGLPNQESITVEQGIRLLISSTKLFASLDFVYSYFWALNDSQDPICFDLI